MKKGHNQSKGKGQGKGERKIHEKGTTTRTRLDLRTRKLDRTIVPLSLTGRVSTRNWNVTSAVIEILF